MRSFGRKLSNKGSTGNLMKQIQKAMQAAEEMQGELAAESVEGSAGGEMVRVTATGAGQLTDIVIAPEVVDPDDVEMLQDLVLAAVRDATEKATAMREERMKGLTGGMPMPPGLF